MIRLRPAAGITAAIAASVLWTAVLSAETLRVVTLSPHAAELVSAAGGGAYLVGVATFTDEPAGTATLPRVSDAYTVDRERILTLHPDLVVAWNGGNRESDIAWLEHRGIRVYRSNPQDLHDIPREIRDLGALMGTQDAAGMRAAQLAGKTDELDRTYAGRKPVRYFFQLWNRPPMTFGGAALLTHALKTCRAENVFDQISDESFTPDPETLSRIDLDVEIIASSLGDVAPLTGAPRTLRTETDGLYRPSPGLLTGLERLCNDLHKDAP